MIQQNPQTVKQTMGQMGQQPQMNMPPVVVTTKDLSFIKDALSWMLIASKKCAHYSKECTDENARQSIDRIGKIHQHHFHSLLAHCNVNNAQAMANVPQAPQQQ